ncbi:MAG TPA: hypothetical protein VI233_03915 [Puia sp.]
MKRILSFGLFGFVVASLATSSSSCKKTVTVVVRDTVRQAWQVLPIYNNLGMAAFNSINVGDTALYIAGSFGVTRVPVNHQPFNNLFTWPLPGASSMSPVLEPPFLDGTLCSYITAQGWSVYGMPPASQYSSLQYNPVLTPGAYKVSLYFAPSFISWPATVYPVVRNRYALMPVESVGTSNTQVRFDLVNWDPVKLVNPLAGPQTPVAKSIVVNAAPGTTGFFQSNYYCAAYYDKFFVSYGGQFFRIDTAGNVKAFGYTPTPVPHSNGIANMFTAGETLFINSGGVIFYSTDRGESWGLWNDFSQSAAGGVIFRNVGKDLYATEATLSSQLWKVVIDGRALNFSELNTDGLESSQMTSITRCGKYVFITTPTGVYYRDSIYFNQLKTPVR